MAPIHHHFEKKGWRNLDCDPVLDHCIDLGNDWSRNFKSALNDQALQVLRVGILFTARICN